MRSEEEGRKKQKNGRRHFRVTEKKPESKIGPEVRKEEQK